MQGDVRISSADPNLTIEGFDISHHGGKHAVASAVRFSSNGPEKNKYRLFNIPKKSKSEKNRKCLL